MAPDMPGIFQLFVLLALLDATASQTSSLSIGPSLAQFNVTYNSTLHIDKGVVFHYLYHHSPHSVVRVTTEMTGRAKQNASQQAEFPLFIVTRQQMLVESWSLPLTSIEHKTGIGARFTKVSRFFCSHGQVLNTSLPITVEASTYSSSSIDLSLTLEILHNFTIEASTHYNIYLAPSYSAYYQYDFKGSKQTATLRVRSPDRFCAIVSIQQATCPVMTLGENIEVRGNYQSFLGSATITLDPSDGDKQYIVFLVEFSDQSCDLRDTILPIGVSKIKHIEFWVEPHIDDMVYVRAISVALVYGLGFYLVLLIVEVVTRCRSRNKDGTPSEEDDHLTGDLISNRPSSYGAIENMGTSSNADPAGSTSPRARELSVQSGRQISADSSIADADFLDDVEDDEEIRRGRGEPTVADLSMKKDKSLRKKYRLYHWNLITIAIFYGLPVVQLVFTYQTYLNESGNQDLCYYNFECSRQLGALHNFNNVFSNVGYIMLGFLFIIITFRRQRFFRGLSEEVRENCGIPPHLGLFYAMGWALIVEGFMSGCYHVCPSYTNFQFDTSFMYILGGLLLLRLFQSRHPDINVTAHVAYLSMAAIIGLALLGVKLNTTGFWVVFTIIHVLFIFLITLQAYYVGQFRFNRTLFSDLKGYCTRTFCKLLIKPVYPSRFVLLGFLNVVNWGIAIYGIITQPADFATHLLIIIIANLAVYCFFYIIMKVVKKEKISSSSTFFMIASLLLWGFSIYFFVSNVTSWQLTPAQSRDLNRPCLILDFFDAHDIWHFLSASAMFCSFMVIFLIDDELIFTPRKHIPVF